MSRTSVADPPKTAASAVRAIWVEIDSSESYLVCCMFDEATALASSILKQLLENNQNDKGCEISEHFDNEWYDMLESSGMVFVQSMKQLKRTSEILKELKLLFGSFDVVPVQVFLTGACFQMSEGLSTTVQDSLEEFLNNWIFVDDRYYPLPSTKARESNTSIGVDKYLEVVELYVVTLLAASVKGMDLAISWVDKAMLPMEKRQDLLRRLQSMSSATATSSSQTSISPQLPDEYKSDSLRDQKQHNEHQRDSGTHPSGQRNYTVKDEIIKLSRQRAPCFWWFPTVNLKVGNIRLTLPSGKLLLASLLLIICYVTRKKQAMLKRVLAKKSASIKKALLDLWQLAFSYQVNPLAAVQPLPNATLGNR